MTTPPMPAPFAPFELAWDAPQLSDADVARDSSVEWWYFDLATPDGVELVVIFGRKNPMWSADKVAMYLEYKDPKQSFHRVRNFDRSRFSWTEKPSLRELRIDTNVVRIVGDDPTSMHYELVLDMPEISGTLTMTPEHRGFLPTANGCYFRNKTDPSLVSCVSFSAPLMSVAGSLVVKGAAARNVTGVGYHDHPWATEQFFGTHSEWHWARATTPDSSVMFATVTPFPEYDGTLTFMYTGQSGVFEPTVSSVVNVTPSEWKKDSLLGINFPHDLLVTTTGRGWNATYQSALLDVPYYTRSAVTWAPTDGSAPGSGWTEYWHLLASRQRFVFWTAKLAAFFWRPFPFFGK